MLKPMLLTDAGPQAFDDPAWLWEVKWDGIRCVAIREGARVRLYSRHQREMTAQFPEVAADLLGALRSDGRYTTVSWSPWCPTSGPTSTR